MPRPRSVSGAALPARGAGPLTATVVAVVSLAFAAGPAAASPGAQAPPQVAVVITAVTPRHGTDAGTSVTGFARPGPGSAVTVKGVVVNPGASTVPGPAVQLWTSGAFASQGDMAGYLTAPGLSGLPSSFAVSQVQTLSSPVPARGTENWSLTVPVGQFGLTAFGVYPLAVQLSSGTGTTATAKTFLPYWPAAHGARDVKPLSLAWVWPLIDAPHRLACPALTGNSLAGSLASGGRLNVLLSAGDSPAGRQAKLTWAIDPALLGDTLAMTHRYQVGADPATCTGGRGLAADHAAQSWLSGVQQVAHSQDFFVTPYDNVDESALVHRGLLSELAAAFTDGQAAARDMFHGRTQNTPGLTGMIAWPAAGVADYSVLEGLASRAAAVKTVVLASSVMPHSPTVATTSDGLGSMNVLLADAGLARLLATPAGQVAEGSPAPSLAGHPTVLSAAATFAQAQSFLAETAMIAASAPKTPRVAVVTPPQHWNPQAGLVTALLSETTSVPWLRPTALASLITAGPAARSQPPPPRELAPGELRSKLLSAIAALYAHASTLQGAIAPDSSTSARYITALSTAVDATESSAWRGGKAVQRRDQQLVGEVSRYVTSQLSAIRTIGPGPVTLGGSSGSVPVSVTDGLPEDIRVKLEVKAPSGSSVSVNYVSKPITVPGKKSKLIKIPVKTSGSGHEELTVWLTTPAGAPLTKKVVVQLSATHFGTLAIVIIVIAMLVFVATAAARAIRRGSGPAEGDEGSGEDGGEADTVESTGAETQPHDSPTAREADDHASTLGRPHRR